MVPGNGQTPLLPCAIARCLAAQGTWATEREIAMGLRVLVTGGAGYLGAVLCDRLLGGGYSVTVLDSLAFGQSDVVARWPNSRLTFVHGDVGNGELLAELVPRADVCVPLAAIVGGPACDRDPSLARSINVDAVRLLDRLRGPGQLLVFPSTECGYGTQDDGAICTEETPLRPQTLYGQMKVDMEQELLGRPDAIALRPSSAFGVSPRMRYDVIINHFVHQAVTTGLLVLFEHGFKRNFVHVGDLADCFVHCIESADSMVGRTYNVGMASANISKGELAMKIKEYVPDLEVQLSANGSDPDTRNYTLLCDRLHSTGFEPRRTLDDGIVELLGRYADAGYRGLSTSRLGY